VYILEQGIQYMSGQNPKERFGKAKPNLFLVPPSAEIYLATAFQDGAVKYGPYNWRQSDVNASTYIAACKRHLASWIDGDDIDETSGVHHLAHAMACLAIILDAGECDTLHDDRPEPGFASVLIMENTKNVV
jgi:hypothetical protein